MFPVRRGRNNRMRKAGMTILQAYGVDFGPNDATEYLWRKRHFPSLRLDDSETQAWKVSLLVTRQLELLYFHGLCKCKVREIPSR